MKTRTRWHLAALTLALAAGGCGGSGLVKVTGKLTYKGQPVPSTYVIFQPEDKTRRASRGLTDDAGNFKLTYSRTETGALRGRYTVFLRYNVGADEELHKIPPRASPELKAVINRYGDPEKSPLHFEITGSGQFIPISLE